jgi:hypothetical protein
MPLPIHCFIHELRNVPENVLGSSPPAIQSEWQKALNALVSLRDAIEDMPPATGGRWFLDIHLASSRAAVTECLRQAVADMRALGTANEQRDLLPGLDGLTNEFIRLANEAENDPFVLQMPYRLHNRLQFQPPELGQPDVD